MKTIIISDLHNRVDWIEDTLSSPILNISPYDKIILLGDYFDHYHDTPYDVIKSAKWLKQSLKIPNRIHLMGTHDIWYRFPFNPYLMVSGNTEEKYYAISTVLNPEDWNLLKLYHYEQNFLMSHAGVHMYLISDYVFKNRDKFYNYITNDNKLQMNPNDIVDKIVRPATENALKRVSQGFSDPWLDAGFARGGLQKVGGIIWLDWNLEFEPIPGLNQIVGHTDREIDGKLRMYPGEKILTDKKNGNMLSINGQILSINYCLDTWNRHMGILENGEFRYIENKLLR